MAADGLKFYQYYHIVCIYMSTFSSPGNKYELNRTKNESVEDRRHCSVLFQAADE